MSYRRDLWEIAAQQHGVLTAREAEDAGVPAVEVRKLAQRGALTSHGQGVYSHRDVPTDELTQPTIAVALAGEGAFLHREAVLDAMGLGQFNPRRIRVGTLRRVRRALPEWMELEHRRDLRDRELIRFAGIPATTVQRALRDVRAVMPPDRWRALVDEALRREMLEESEAQDLAERSDLHRLVPRRKGRAD
jgi:predicted transcriptional regulator of viral defense system